VIIINFISFVYIPQHIRGYFQRYALYKSTFYLLTYLLSLCHRVV